MPKATMRDVAKHAGVSVATVSHVINKTRFVAEETQNRVSQSIQELDYSPDQMARNFKTGHKNLIGFIVPDIANIFFSQIIEEIETVIARDGYRLIISNTKETQDREISNIRVLANGIVDGLIVASTMESFDQLKPLFPDDLPVIFVDRTFPDCPYDTITISNYRAVFSAVETLYNAGHKKIGYIKGIPHLSTTKERFLAYKNAMEHFQLPIEDGYIYIGNSMHNGVEHYVEKLIDTGCTAVIVSNNIMADDVLFYLREHNLRDKITLVGYNDSDTQNYGLRHIYTVCQPAIDLGRAAGMQILDRIANPNIQAKQIILQASFCMVK